MELLKTGFWKVKATWASLGARAQSNPGWSFLYSSLLTALGLSIGLPMGIFKALANAYLWGGTSSAILFAPKGHYDGLIATLKLREGWKAFLGLIFPDESIL